MNYLKQLLQNLKHPAGIAGTLIALLIPFLIYLAPNCGAKDLIQTLDLRLPLPLFLFQMVLGLFLFATLFRDARSFIMEHLPAKKYLIALGIIAISATVFAGIEIEARHRVQSDESVFLSVAQNLYHNQISGTCDEGEFQNGRLDCYRNSNSFKTKGLSFLYFIGMPFAGSDLHWIFGMELAFLFLTAILFFFAVRAWTEDDLLSLLSTVLLIAQPTVLFQFRSASVEPLYILLSAFSLWALRWAYERNTIRHWLFVALELAFFAQTRQETVFCLLAFVAVALPKILDRKDLKAPAFFVTLSLFSVPVLLTISYFQGYNFQGGEFSAHGHFIENLTRNWEVMTRPLNESGLLDNPFLSSFNYLFLIGFIILVIQAGREIYAKKFGTYTKIAGFLLLYHIQTYVILENVSGDFTIEINQRYSLVMMPTMAFLGALALRSILYTAFFLFGFSNLKNNPKVNLTAAVLFSVAILGNTASYKQSFNEDIMYNRNHLTNEEVEIWKWLKAQPQKPRLFVYGRPWHFVGYGESAIHYDRVRALSPDSLEHLIDKYNGEVYYIRGLDCWDSKTYHAKAIEHRIPTTCDVFEREAKLEDVYSVLITNNYWVRIARLKAKHDYDPANLFQFGFWQGTPEKKELIVDYVMNYGGNSPWNVKLVLNGDSIKSFAYRPGDASDTLKGPVLKPGYNKMEVLISDSTTGEVIAVATDFRFFRFDGALQMNLMSPVHNTQGWGELQVNKSIDGHEFTLASRHFKDGFGTHAPSNTEFDIRGEFTRFTALIGLDEESLCSDGVSYTIKGDGKVLYQIEKISLEKIDTLDISVEGVHSLVIESDPLGSKDCDHIDIVHPTLYPKLKK